MKTTGKIIITLSILAVVILVVSSFFMRTNMSFSPQEAANGRPAAKRMMKAAPKMMKAAPNPVDIALRKMELANIAYNAPTKINIEDNPKIQLILSLAEPIAKLKKLINEEGQKLGAQIKVSNIMLAHLSGPGFDITIITPEKQLISKIEKTEWKWEIHPKEEGKHRLYLTLSALLEVNGKSSQRAIKTFEKTIEVTVTNSQHVKNFIGNNWQWLWATFLAPLAVWFGRGGIKKFAKRLFSNA